MLLLLLACAADPDAPPEIAYDVAACDECGMLVGDPTHAAALVDGEGHTRVFDDPGCLFRYVAEQHPTVTRMWFSDGTRWYREGEVGFVVGGDTPMASGLHAVPAETPGALGVGEASNRAMAK
jgi:hypothetical protein